MIVIYLEFNPLCSKRILAQFLLPATTQRLYYDHLYPSLQSSVSIQYYCCVAKAFCRISESVAMILAYIALLSSLASGARNSIEQDDFGVYYPRGHNRIGEKYWPLACVLEKSIFHSAATTRTACPLLLQVNTGSLTLEQRI